MTLEVFCFIEFVLTERFPEVPFAVTQKNWRHPTFSIHPKNDWRHPTFYSANSQIIVLKAICTVKSTVSPILQCPIYSANRLCRHAGEWALKSIRYCFDPIHRFSPIGLRLSYIRQPPFAHRTFAYHERTLAYQSFAYLQIPDICLSGQLNQGFYLCIRNLTQDQILV